MILPFGPFGQLSTEILDAAGLDMYSAMIIIKQQLTEYARFHVLHFVLLAGPEHTTCILPGTDRCTRVDCKLDVQQG